MQKNNSSSRRVEHDQMKKMVKRVIKNNNLTNSQLEKVKTIHATNTKDFSIALSSMGFI